MGELLVPKQPYAMGKNSRTTAHCNSAACPIGLALFLATIEKEREKKNRVWMKHTLFTYGWSSHDPWIQNSFLWIQNSCIAQEVPGYSRKLRFGAPLFCYGIAMPRKQSWLTGAAVYVVVLSSACNCHAFQPAVPGGCMAARRGPDPASVAHPIRYPSAFLNC